jgi:hypothetical protein
MMEGGFVVTGGYGLIFEVDPEDGHCSILGGGGASLNGLACNPVNNELYGAGDTALYLIDPNTYALTFVANFSGNGGNTIIGMAFDSNGILYGWDVKFNGSSYLYTINTTTAQCTIVGSMGITLCYAQDGAFDYVTDTLYLSAFTVSPNWGGYLYTCDKNTGACTLVGAFPGITEIDALAIPYIWRPIAKFIWTPIPPEPGETIFFNASDSYDPDGHITLYEWDWDNDGIFDENHTTVTATHSWSDRGCYPVTLRVTDNSSFIGKKTKTVRVGNQPPKAPKIYGPTQGKVGVTYNYIFRLNDPDSDAIYLRVDWGNGTTGPWQELYESNMDVLLSHTWNKKGTFTIKAQARDIYGAESDWGTLTVKMPRSKQNTINFWSQQLLDRFPFL